MTGKGEHNLIFISLEPWDEVWRRNQFLAAGLARRWAGAKILFVGPAVDVSAAVRHRRLGEMRGAGLKVVPRLDNVGVLRVRKWLPNSMGVGRRVNATGLRRGILRAMRRMGMDGAGGRGPTLWINDCLAEHLVGTLGESGVVYDITDDWTCFGEDGRTRRRLIEHDRRLTERADAVIVCSEALAASKRAHQEKSHLILNGVDRAHYAGVLDEAGPLPAAAQGWAKPVLGYTGTVHRDRVDLALVEAVARRLERGTLVLIGPSHLSEAERRALEATGRVVVVGPVPYAELPGYMRGLDVCVVPHRVTAFTESLNPIKLWEYLASGKPIVSTPVAGFRDFPNHVRLASGAEAFVAAVNEALAEGPAAGRARRAAAADHGWDRRVDQVQGVLDGLGGAVDAEPNLTSPIKPPEPVCG